ncbi:MAG: phosphoribosylglycinamide synthetase C domain-containing protein [Candidatus Aenigmatarchaeota archaeon]
MTNEKKKILFVSSSGLIGDLAWKVKSEGHEVKLFIEDKEEKDVCDGFVDKVEKWEDFKDWADLIVFDDVGFGSIAEKLRKEGKLVVGGSIYTDKLEIDRDFGYKEMKDVGINVIPSWIFTDFDEAIKFVKENPDRYVIKPSGIKQEEQKELSFVGTEEDGKDVIQVLELYKLRWSKQIKSFQIQKFISGVEIAIGAFFNGEDFIYPINVNFEHKKLFPGNIGPSTWEMGETMYWSQPNTLFNETLLKMKEKLKQSGYVGYIDINTIVNGRGIYPLEWTARFGIPTISIQIEGVLSNWGEFLYSLAKKENFELKTKKGFQVGVVLAVPPFPFYDPKTFKKYSEDALIIFKKPDMDGIRLGEVKLIDGNWILAGCCGYAIVVVGTGTTMEEARKIAYNKISNIIIPNMFYRTDIGERWFTDSDKLFSWGYI